VPNEPRLTTLVVDVKMRPWRESLEPPKWWLHCDCHAGERL